ncbi:hypothetical protein BD769DRAFT_1772928 [Suillus cothurnatus]|nr:hypothetical protein BD769DRAFT_1772928 [Suillus cothurnatus]
MTFPILCFWLPIYVFSYFQLPRRFRQGGGEQDRVCCCRGRKDEPDFSDDEDDRLEDEFITSFNKFGAQRVNGKKPKTKASTGPLVIPSKPNPDWQEAARSRRTGAAQFIPDLARASTGADGSIGGLGTRDTINSGPQLSGIQFGNKRVKVDTSTTSTDGETNMTVEEHVKIDIVHRRDGR